MDRFSRLLLGHLDLIPGEAVDPWDSLHLLAEDLPGYSSDEHDQGEFEVDGPRSLFWSSDEEDGSDDFGSSDEEDWNDDFGSSDEEDWSDADCGYKSRSEEEEDEDQRAEDRYFARLPLEVFPLGRRGVPAPPVARAACSPPAPHPLPVGPALDFLPPSGRKRFRDEEDEEEEDPSSKRPCLSSSNLLQDSESDED